jgi:hypothetical protein
MLASHQPFTHPRETDRDADPTPATGLASLLLTVLEPTLWRCLWFPCTPLPAVCDDEAASVIVLKDGGGPLNGYPRFFSNVSFSSFSYTREEPWVSIWSTVSIMCYSNYYPWHDWLTNWLTNKLACCFWKFILAKTMVCLSMRVVGLL